MIGLFHWWQARCIYFWTSVQRERNCIWLFLFKFETRERVIIYAIFNPVDAILKRVWVTMLSTPSPFRLTDNMEVKTTSYFACNIQFSKHEPKQYTPRDTRTTVIITYILEQKKEDFFTIVPFYEKKWKRVSFKKWWKHGKGKKDAGNLWNILIDDLSRRMCIRMDNVGFHRVLETDYAAKL